MTSGATKINPNKNDNFTDLHKPLNRLQAITEAARCTYCYDAPCIKACPTGIDIPTFIHQIRTDNITGAAKTILQENIMGGTCARACPTEVLCERACVRNHDQGKPVEIGLLQRFAVDDLVLSDEPHPFVRAPETDKRIAVVGAGPAGLSCAHRAALIGHTVTVFDGREKAGGLNEYGLAAYKMVDDFAQKEVEFLLGIGGIEMRHQQRLGQEIQLADLQQQYDAVFLAIGLSNSNQLGLENESLNGVVDAIDFIEDIRQAKDLNQLDAGDSVVVIGGGNTAIDAAVQAKRLGAEQVTLVYRRGEEHMSATDWEIELARKNGVTIQCWAKPIQLHGTNKVETITFEDTHLEQGRLVGTGDTFEIEVDRVYKAIGQSMNTDALTGLTLANGKIVINEHFQTNLKNVFAGGDCIASGEDLTVQAVEDGKRAAHAMGRVLFGIDVTEIF
ncbi:NAD(P)-dependent oxidoreductase [Aliiglaciecola litoralis]|uniref:dihydrouracil dehydrogenase (NAD(+)) n=1 Tax=Aliiglaciecola litoralis TaxID=582857 RepID=A0ABP3X4R4_9ALTE